MARTYGTHCIVYATCNFQKNLSPCYRNFTATSHKSSMSQTSFGNTTQRAQRVFCLKVVSLQTCFVRKTCHNLLLPHVCPLFDVTLLVSSKDVYVNWAICCCSGEWGRHYNHRRWRWWSRGMVSCTFSYHLLALIKISLWKIRLQIICEWSSLPFRVVLNTGFGHLWL